MLALGQDWLGDLVADAARVDWPLAAGWLLSHGLVFTLVYGVFGFIPAAWLWRRIHHLSVKSDLLAAGLLGFLVIFGLQYVTLWLRLPDVLVWLLGLAILAGWWRDRALRYQLRMLGRRGTRREWGLICLLVILSLTWTLPSLFTGWPTTDGGIMFTRSLGGERLLFTAYGQAALHGIPPFHPYWAAYPLSYHYFGMLIQNFFVRFGLSPVLTNFTILPTVVALFVGLTLWWLSKQYTSFRFALVAPLIFMLWDNPSWLLPAALHYPGRASEWWLTPFQAQHHVYLNGQSYQFAALFIAFTAFMVYQLARAPHPHQPKGLAVLLGVSVAVLMLVKVQVFLVLVGGLMLGQRWVRLPRIMWISLLLVMFFVVYTNRQFLLAGATGSLAWQPFNQLFLSAQALSPAGSWLGATGGWRLLVALVGALVLTFGTTLLGLAAAVFYKLRRDPFIMVMMGCALTALLFMFILRVGNHNDEWQFSYAAYPFLAILTAGVLWQLGRWRWPMFILLTLVSLPTMIGQLVMYSDGYVVLPQTELQAMRVLAQQTDRNDTCLLALPRESVSETGRELTITNQIREVIFPIYANCPLVAALGESPRVNGRVTDQAAINQQRAVYQVFNMSSDFLALVNEYQPTYVWIASRNLYGVNPKELAGYMYEDIIHSNTFTLMKDSRQF